MEVVIPVLFVLSLLLNVGQGVDNVKDERKIEQQSEYIIELEDKNKILSEANTASLIAYEEVVTQNDRYDDVVADLEDRIKNCNEDLREQIDKINNWKDSDRLKQVAIEDLIKELDNRGDVPSCRVPVWVDFEASRE